MGNSYLTREQQIDLAARMRAGDLGARDQLVMSVDDLAWRFANRWYSQQERDDLHQDLMLLLVSRIHLYDPTWAISTFAGRVFEFGFLSALKTASRRSEFPPAISLDTVGSAYEGGPTLAQFIADPVDLIVGPDERMAWMREAIDRLPEGDRDLLVSRWGLDESRPVTLAALARELGLTRQAIAIREHKAIRRLRAELGIDPELTDRSWTWEALHKRPKRF